MSCIREMLGVRVIGVDSIQPEESTGHAAMGYYHLLAELEFPSRQLELEVPTRVRNNLNLPANGCY
jgi:hypothetical protein